jgi:hypothetical protein
VPIKSDDIRVGWKELAVETVKLQEKYPRTFIFSNDNYKTSACLNFFMDDKVYAKNIIGLLALYFDCLSDDLPTLNMKNTIFIDSDKRFNNNQLKGNQNPVLNKYFDTMTELEPIIIKINNKQSKRYWAFYCTNYQYKK